VRSGYGEAVVLDDISFEVAERGSLAVLGRNGVGKSTLLLTIMGFTGISRGAIRWRGGDITVLFIEHDMNFVFRFASRIIVMVGGRILLEGAPDEIAADPRVREVYLGKSHGARHG
jgi:ABC-type branched-subunit amino acid transport system ATPase component